MTNILAPQRYYRLPWSLSDNAISWLEVTTRCNLSCRGCYRDQKRGGHKTLDEIAADLRVFKRERASDCISIAGGDPLVHPRICDIVKMVRKKGWKPIINTNGVRLTPKLLKELKAAGAFGFTFHVDTSQQRKNFIASTEKDLNLLRQRFAEMLAAEGGLTCSFNQTVTSDTLSQIPDVVRWAMKHPDIVHTVVFILYREPGLFGEYDFYAGGEKVEVPVTYQKVATWGGKHAVRTPETVAKIREADPAFEPSAYLNGTEDATSTKWLLGTRIASRKRTFGYVTPTFMETVQEGHRLLQKKWLAYAEPRFLSLGRVSALLMAPFDRGMRRIASEQAWELLKNPFSIIEPHYMQTFTVIQPSDVLPDGRISMCDGCPDMTVHNGRLAWSCRLEELKQHGRFLTAVPRKPKRLRAAG